MRQLIRTLKPDFREKRLIGAGTSTGSDATPARKIISWNLLHSVGATVHDVADLIRNYQPDLLLMQEATASINALPHLVGGYYARTPLPDRVHGLACWSRTAFHMPPDIHHLPSGALIRRVAQFIHNPDFSVVNVHLSHGQVLNRRQLRSITETIKGPAAILGDFNLVGPTLLPGFQDVGPRAPTHKMADLIPIRLDRCMVHGLTCAEARVLPISASDHKPIEVMLSRQ
ncbi:MAG: endonuclease/exonuclease/phosphatase family protein [Acetobacter sp.]|jgi:endonuclease/exonuclease/phosphatase (EEP) superfamily protein YafD